MSHIARGARSAWGVVATLLVVVYPLLVYVGLTRLDARSLGLLLLLLLLPPHLVRAWRSGREHLLALLPLPAGIAALLLVAAAVDDRRLVLALPVLINLVLLGNFAASLRGRVTAIERFARMQVADLSAEEVVYCRKVTALWCVFFAANAVLTATLALAAPVSVWAVWTGAGAYLLVGLLFSIEYVVRKARFGRLGPSPVDRLLARMLRTGRGG